ncbi:class I SAM-dependent methyltransferase [Patescibacteria group bacterium]|nr:class I SAM-dependent methyltransferase [Patescibacteria group bacterium]
MDKSKSSVAVYNQIATQYAKQFNRPSEHLGEFLRKLPKGGMVLDVGCGTGRDTGFIHSKGFKVVGFDLSREMLNVAKRDYPAIDFRLEDMRKIKLPAQSADGIVASCSLIHIPKKNVPALLRQFHKLLKPNGVLYIGFQAGRSREMFVDEPFKPGEKLFLNVISLPEITRLLKGTGFKVVKSYSRQPSSNQELNFTKLYLIAQRP